MLEMFGQKSRVGLLGDDVNFSIGDGLVEVGYFDLVDLVNFIDDGFVVGRNQLRATGQ